MNHEWLLVVDSEYGSKYETIHNPPQSTLTSLYISSNSIEINSHEKFYLYLSQTRYYACADVYHIHIADFFQLKFKINNFLKVTLKVLLDTIFIFECIFGDNVAAINTDEKVLHCSVKYLRQKLNLIKPKDCH